MAWLQRRESKTQPLRRLGADTWRSPEVRLNIPQG